MERLHFYYFHMNSLQLHTLQYVMSVAAAVIKHMKSRYKWKPRLLQLSWRLKGTHLLFLLIFGLFLEVLTYFLNAIFWSIKTADAITQCISTDVGAVQSICRWQNKNWACIDVIHGEYPIIQNGGPKWGFYCKRKLQISLSFLKDPGGWQVVRMQRTYKTI